MGNRISVDGLAASVMEGLNGFRDEVNIDMKAAVEATGKAVQSQIKASAPRSAGRKRSGKYAKSWRTKKTAETATKLEVTVYAGEYSLAHLLEYGHAKRGGGRTKAQPHIEPAEKNGIALLEAEIERSLKRG